MKKYFFFYLLIIFNHCFSQGTIPKGDPGFKGSLLLKGFEGTSPSVKNPSQMDIKLAPETWSDDANYKVRGLVSEAKLLMGWWTLTGEPIEDYMFYWNSSGQYEIQYTNDHGGLATEIVSRSSLQKYPDLLQRFDDLTPSAIDFTINFNLGNIGDEEYKEFKDNHGIIGDIGSSAPYIDNTFTRKVFSSGLLFNACGKEAYHVPAALGWKEFFGLSQNYDEDKLSMIVEFYKLMRNVRIVDFKITRLEWPTGEMKAIAKAFEDYEKGIKLPSDTIAKANNIVDKYNGDDEWSEPYEQEKKELVEFKNDKDEYGFKDIKGKVIIPPLYKNDYYVINCSKDYGRVAFPLGDAVVIYNTNGKEIKRYDNARIASPKNNCHSVYFIIIMAKTAYAINIKTLELISLKEGDKNCFWRDVVFFCKDENGKFGDNWPTIYKAVFSLNFKNEEIVPAPTNDNSNSHQEEGKNVYHFVVYTEPNFTHYYSYYGITQDDRIEYIKDTKKTD